MLRALLLAIALCAPALAQAAVTAEDLAEIRAVINRQIEAFRRDDAESAFALVSARRRASSTSCARPITRSTGRPRWRSSNR